MVLDASGYGCAVSAGAAAWEGALFSVTPSISEAILERTALTCSPFCCERSNGFRGCPNCGFPNSGINIPAFFA
jgi:hypothetical protein